MRIWILLVLFAASMVSSEEAFQNGWTLLPGYSLYDIYQYGGTEQSLNKRDIKIVSTSATNWPDGRQMLLTFIEVKQDGNKWLYRCIDYTDSNFQSTGQICFELRQPKKSK